MGILNIVLVALGALPSVLDALKALFAAVAQLFDTLGQPKAAAVTQQATDITSTIEGDLGTATKWFNDSFPTIEALLTEFTGLPKLLYSASNIMKDQSVSSHVAITAAQLGANAVIVAQTPKP